MEFWQQVNIIVLIGFIFTIANLLIARSNAKSNKRSEKRQGVLDVLSLFASEDVLEGTRALWWMYGQRGGKVDYPWIKMIVHEARKGGLLDVPPQFWHQRRTVSHFWIMVGTLLKYELIDSKIAFELWSKEDVKIVENIIIPLENEIALEHGDTVLTDSHALCYIVKNKDKFR
ncbi:MAG: hypothetical protein JRI87_10685 [Deltaproteobacteria bacterium]|nr:hypothetical protein [Deltaproteobacteria bacterium]